MQQYHILSINPGSTSTKLGYYRDMECVSVVSISHDVNDLSEYPTIADQYVFRRNTIDTYLREHGIALERLDAIAARGGLLRPLKSGTYRVDAEMIQDLKMAKYGQHASNLGAIIASDIAEQVNIPAFVVNPVVVDEFENLARYSGIPEISRVSAFHALNQKAIALRAARELGADYGDVNLVVAHMGGGISVGAHSHGKVIDVNNALEDGPFSPERSGNVPVMQLVSLCYSGKYTKEEISKKLIGQGGLTAYLGTSDVKKIAEMIQQGNIKAEEILQALAYQVSKEIGACSAVLFGEVDGIVLTGGLAYSKRIVSWITQRVSFIAPVVVYPGEDELGALAEGVYKVLIGEESAHVYGTA